MVIGPVDTSNTPFAKLRTLPLDEVSLGEGFWYRRQVVNRQASLYHGYEHLERAGNFHNLKLTTGRVGGGYRGMVFADSDVYKWLEAASYELAARPDSDLRRMAEYAIDLVEAAQGNDGYVNSYWQVVQPGRRWEDLTHGHEMYCAGHLIQAAVAYDRATGNARLLSVARRFADYIHLVFGPDKRTGTPGHPEIEMALVELYRHTAERRYMELAGCLVDRRGDGSLGPGRFGSEYFQDHVAVREASTMAGHVVRQLYLTAGVADLYLETGEQALYDALMRQWSDMSEHHLFVTGGVGSLHRGEAFGEPYVLPNESCYCETCAQIASVMWNWRMLLATGEAKFADLMELTLYNGFLSGVSLDGRGFFYVNPLQSTGVDDNSGSTRSTRPEWFDCACCPPNVMRLIGSLGHYLATRDTQGLQVHQYAPATVGFEAHSGQRALLRIETEYPWQGTVRITIDETGDDAWQLSLRVPGWAEGASIHVNGQPWNAMPVPGTYVTVNRTWRVGDTVKLDLPLASTLVQGHPRIESVRGCVAIQRGPIVYCLEQADQAPSVDVMGVEIELTGQMRDSWQPDLLDGVISVQADGYAVESRPWQGRLYRPAEKDSGIVPQPISLNAVPYYAWANRGPNAMRVWTPATRTSQIT